MSPRATQPRMPALPLLVALGAESQVHAARLLDRHLRVITRWIREGIPILTAERLADEHGLHPTLVWGREFSRLMTDYEDQTARRRATAYRRKLAANARYRARRRS